MAILPEKQWCNAVTPHDPRTTPLALLYAENKQPFYGPLVQDNPGELVLSQSRDLLEQPVDFYEPGVLPAAEPVVSKHYRKLSGLVVFCFTDIVSATHV